jgi:hypothetical protein
LFFRCRKISADYAIASGGSGGLPYFHHVLKSTGLITYLDKYVSFRSGKQPSTTWWILWTNLPVILFAIVPAQNDRHFSFGTSDGTGFPEFHSQQPGNIFY